METKIKGVFENIQDSELQGTYYPLKGMTKEIQTQLIADHFLFKGQFRLTLKILLLCAIKFLLFMNYHKFNGYS
jgi:hypothetical protein